MRKFLLFFLLSMAFIRSVYAQDPFTIWFNQAIADIERTSKEMEKAYVHANNEVSKNAVVFFNDINRLTKELENSIQQFQKMDCEKDLQFLVDFVNSQSTSSTYSEFMWKQYGMGKYGIDQGECQECMTYALKSMICHIPEIIQGNVSFVEKMMEYESDVRLKDIQDPFKPIAGFVLDMLETYRDEVLSLIEVAAKFEVNVNVGGGPGFPNPKVLYENNEICSAYGDLIITMMTKKLELKVKMEKKKVKAAEIELAKKYKLLGRILKMYNVFGGVAKLDKLTDKLNKMNEIVPASSLQNKGASPKALFRVGGAENIFIDATGNHLWADPQNWSWLRMPMPYETVCIPDNKLVIVDREVWVKNVLVDNKFTTTSRQPSHPYEGLVVYFEAKHSKLVLAVAGDSQQDGGNIIQWRNTLHPSQQFKLSATGYNDGSYYIKNVLSGKYLEVSRGNAGNLFQNRFTGSHAQCFYLRNAGMGYHYIVSKFDNYNIDIKEVSKSQGANVYQFKPTGGDNQKFKLLFQSTMVGANRLTLTKSDNNLIGHSFYLEAKHSGKVLAVSGDSKENGGNIIQWHNNQHPSQQFVFDFSGELDGSYKIKNVLSGKYIDVYGRNKDNGANINQWDINRSVNCQKFFIEETGNGYVRIRAKHSGKVLDVSGQETQAGANVQQWEELPDDDSQLFKLIPATLSGQIYNIENKKSGKVFDVGAASLDDGAYIEQWDLHNGLNQQFLFQFAEMDYTTPWFYIINVNSGKYLQMELGKGESCLEQRGMNKFNDRNKMFRIVRYDNDYVYIQHRYSSKYMRVYHCDTSGGKKLQLVTGNDRGDCQLFNLKKVN